MSKADDLWRLRERQVGVKPGRREAGAARGALKPVVPSKRLSEEDAALLERLARRCGVRFIVKAVAQYEARLKSQRELMRERRAGEK